MPEELSYACAKRTVVSPQARGRARSLIFVFLLLFVSQVRSAFPQNPPPANPTAISPVEQITDSVLFEDIKDPAKRLYLPRFKLATQTVSGELQYRVRLIKEGQGANLEVYLEKYPAPELGDAARTAQEIPYEAKVLLRYNLPANGHSAQANVYKELAFQEVTFEKGGLKAVLHVNTLEERDALIYALESPNYDATLLARRTLTARTRPLGEIHALSALATARRFSLAHAGRAGVSVPKEAWDEVDQMDARVQSLRTIGVPVTVTLDDTVPRRPLAFDRRLYPYVFAGIRPNPDAKPQLVRRQVPWQSRYYSYFRPAGQPDLWYYLPDRFVLAEENGVPRLRAEFSGGENQTVELEYVAAPQTESKRLEAAEASLRPTPNSKITFEPLLVESAQLWLALPGGGSNGPYQQREGASVDLRDGVKDRLRLSLSAFQEIYEALFNNSMTLLTGEVRLAPDGTIQERIPVELRVRGLTPEALWDKVVSQTVLATYQKKIEVKTTSGVFKNGVQSLVVEFLKGGDTVELGPNKLDAKASVWLPVRDFVLNTENKGKYCYTVTVIREQEAKFQTSEPSCKTATILYAGLP